jgi:hypothetical protein
VLLLLTPLVAWRASGVAAGRRVALDCGGLVALALVIAMVNPTFRLRVAEPEVANWYGARYTSGPLAPMAPNEVRQVPVTIANSGLVAWEPTGLRPVRLAYHWVDAKTGAVVRYEGRRTLLPRPVAPGESLALMASVQAPRQPGRYVLVWDMLREYIGRGWFSQMGVPTARVAVEVSGPPAATPPPSADAPHAPQAINVIPGPPGRRQLWGVALSMWRERPLLGIGPDVFRHRYGARLGLSVFDDRVHTNNLYLELLTGAGVVGLLSFLALVGLGLWAGWRSLPSEHSPAATALLAGAWLGVFAFLAHGTLDVFLAFTPTYALLWVLLGTLGGLTIRSSEIHFAPRLRILQKAL